MTFNAIEIFRTAASFTVKIPLSRYTEWEMLSNILDKHNGFAQVKITKPFKPRSTGAKSQSNHLHGHIQQIAAETYHTMSEIKDYIKTECPNWPSEEVLGKLKPKSESKLSMEQEALVIEWVHALAYEQNIRLVEE